MEVYFVEIYLVKDLMALFYMKPFSFLSHRI
jgi:hypothetical protein